jgi:hypothetical protein
MVGKPVFPKNIRSMLKNRHRDSSALELLNHTPCFGPMSSSSVILTKEFFA